ncbi:protein C Serine peptidase. MEROPS family S49 [Nitrosospira multiformis ATCC 25196]|uniref:Protein C Serine peptidase. MEROPS family S49 n=1 Tax=Nitrosospira multiformis (strain ATCC 25196 / NCIMB 11849 / C 71) TaxID=323848 RepID=Q2YD05_NITMU|nr:S49 family peptidase [Nitrosospira multiformis]ABB73366.1 protein C, Serine peptidase, MEROPS family S49 [Nitrosospira multiformis ATCC 25196]SEG17362.1 protein C Serine peptidase. MEROPS family S49 [Nitrosospira multiformis ATCC 25196]
MSLHTELFGRPWALHKETFESLIRNAHAAGPGLKFPASQRKSVSQDGVAVIDITGPITPRASFLSLLFGGTDVETIQQDLSAALADSSVNKIVLNIDSPGGVVSGVSPLADQIFSARSIKPIESFVSGMGASAAYWLAAATSHITISDTALVGSIGVVGTAIDDKARQQMQGVIFHQIVSSNAPKKRPDPATPEGLQVLQKEIDSLASVFTAKVARYRGVNEMKVNSDFGQGGVLVGVEAVRAGLADAIGTFESTLVSSGAMPSAARATKKEEQISMSLEESCAAQWRNDPQIREEFVTLEGFTAYTRAAAAGSVKILRRV